MIETNCFREKVIEKLIGKTYQNYASNKLDRVADVLMGQSPKSDALNQSVEGIEFHQGKVFFGKELLANSPIYTNQPTKIVDKDAVLVCMRAPVGDVNIVDRVICIGRGLSAIIPRDRIDLKFLYYVMIYNKETIKSKSSGTTFSAITKQVLLEIQFPLPPLEEQKRIVTKIEELFAKIDEIDKAQKELKELAELAEKKVLDMAVRGELVEQDETEGSGNEELNAIEAYLLDNKLLDKKRLNLTVTVDEPFPIPSTWVWTKIGFVTNYADKKEKATERIHLPTKLIDMENIVKDTGEFIDVTNVADISNLADRVVFHKSDVLYGRLRPYLRKIAVAKYDGICSPEIVPFRGYFHVDSEYLCAVMRSGYISSAVNLAMHGVNMPRASKELIQNLAFPLPPYFEQVRISNAVKAFVENIRLLY